MVQQGFLGNLFDALDEFSHIRGFHDLCIIGETENKIPKTKIACNKGTEVIEHGLGPFIQKLGLKFFCQGTVGLIAGLHHHRHTGLNGSHPSYKPEPSLGIFLAVTGKTDIGNNTDHIAAVALDEFFCCFVVYGQQDLWPAPQMQQALSMIQAFVYQVLGLVHDLLIDQGQQHRIHPRRILDNQDGPHIPPQDIQLGVLAVFCKFDNGRKDRGVPGPDKNTVNGFRGDRCRQLLQFCFIKGQQYDRFPGVFILNGSAQ